MSKSIGKTIKATIINIIVALFSIALIIFIVNLFFRAKIDEAISLVSKVSIDIQNKESIVPIKTVTDEKEHLKNYPEYGTQYATIEIPKIDVNLPVYYGDTLEILKNGVGHSSGSYFPGEGGTVVFMGHNSKKVFRRFSELKIGDEITVKANYGEYKYKIYDMKVLDEKDFKDIEIQRNKEILMVYTCYPFVYIGYTSKRYMVYAEKIEE